MNRKPSDAQLTSPTPAIVQSDEVPSLGMNRKWTSDSALAKKQRDRCKTFTDAGSPASQRFERLRTYADGKNPYPDLLDACQPRRGPLAAAVADDLWGDPTRIERWATPLLQGASSDIWLPDFAHDAAYGYWRWRVKSTLPTQAGRVFLETPASAMACCLYLGWMDEARYLAGSIREAYAQRRLANVSGRGCQPLNHFLLRVAFDFWEIPFEGWGKGHNPRLDPKLDPKDIFGKNECFGEPVLNHLYEHWRDSDLDAQTAHLAWTADYTTHRLNADCEFEWGGPLAARMPGVLLPLARFRACLGLGMPPVDHPLMTGPYAALPVPCPVYSDALLDDVIDRLTREELPDLRA